MTRLRKLMLEVAQQCADEAVDYPRFRWRQYARWCGIRFRQAIAGNNQCGGI